MPQNLNYSPYFDDFKPENDFHQILFKPGYAVQARELTQLQTILRNQIEQFGNHVFRHGSIVIPGNSFSDTKIPYVKVLPTFNGNAINYAVFEGKTIVGETSGVKAYVKKVLAATDTDPITMYLSYISGGTTLGVANGKVVFDSNEVLRIEALPTIAATSAASATGYGAMAFVNEGVYYVNGTFANVSKQSVVISKYSDAPSCHVLLKINETIVNSNDDVSLLDPAQGSYNFTAPGADRLKITLELVSLPIGTAFSSDYVELMRYENGELLEHFNSPRYSELEKSLAQRTYDESGDYVVNGLDVSIREHKKSGTNNGFFLDGDFGKMIYTLSPGKAYIRGLAVENIGSKQLVVDKARTIEHVIQRNATVKPSWGQYLLVSGPQGTLNIQSRETIQLWNVSAISGGTQIGTAKVIGLDYHIGDGSANPIYKLYVSDLNLTSGSYDDIGSIRLASANFSAKVVAEYEAPITSGAFLAGDVITFNATSRTATVSFYDAVSGLLYAHKHVAATPTPKTGDSIVGPTATSVIKSKTMIGKTGTGSLVFELPASATKALKNVSNAFDLQYTHWSVLNIPEGSTTVSIGAGTIVPIEAGTFIALTNSGTDPRTNYSLGGGGNSVTRTSAAPAGGVTIYCQVVKEIATPRTKTIATHSGTYTPASVVMLSHADAYQLESVISGGVNITSRYTLDNGQTDYDYGISSLKLKNGFSVPADDLTVTYKYFQHSVGDFFSVDSYPVGLPNDSIPSYRSPTTGLTYELRDCLDYRKTVGMNSNVIVPDTFINTSIQQYAPRIDVVCIDKQGNFSVINGTPALNPQLPVIPTTLYALNKIRVPAFTYSLSDVVSRRMAVRRYTMENVASLENRILGVEQYSMLTAAEAQATNTPFIDAATGLDRFKTGYLVESLEDPFQLAAVNDSSFSASVNMQRGITAKLEEHVVNFGIVSTGVQNIDTTVSGLIAQTDTRYTGATVFNTGGLFTLPYYDKIFAQVTVSSRVENVNPFLVVGWNGVMTLSPSGDVWVDVIDLPEIVNNVTVTTTQWQPAPEPAPFVIGPAGPPIQPAGMMQQIIWGPEGPPQPAPQPEFVPSPFVIGPTPAPAPAPVIAPEPAPAPAPSPWVEVGPNSSAGSGGMVNLETNQFVSSWGQQASPVETNWWNGD